MFDLQQTRYTGSCACGRSLPAVLTYHFGRSLCAFTFIRSCRQDTARGKRGTSLAAVLPLQGLQAVSLCTLRGQCPVQNQ